MKLLEIKSFYLYKAVNDDVINSLEKNKSYLLKGNKQKFTSTTRKLSDIDNQFGSGIVQIDISKLPLNCKIIDVKYNWDWLKSNPEICMKVTGKSPEDWEEWSADNSEINNEIKELYGSEKETIIVNLQELNSAFCKIV